MITPPVSSLLLRSLEFNRTAETGIDAIYLLMGHPTKQCWSMRSQRLVYPLPPESWQH